MKKNLNKGGGVLPVPESTRTFKNLVRMTKLTLFCFLLGLTQVVAVNSYSQGNRFSIKQENQRLETVLGTIEDQTNYFFIYNRDLVDVEQVINVDIQSQTIAGILEKVLENTNIRYSIVDRQIVLSNEMIDNTVQQQRTISGKVTATSGESLPGVTVVVKGTTRGTITDENGNFTVGNISPGSVLIFSFVGMKQVEISTDGKSVIDVTMTEESIGLEEVVAIGYGTMRKSDLTGSVASVDTEELTKTQQTSIAQAIQGRAAGVTVTKTTGAPGATPNVRIRGIGTVGNADPLYIVDGVPINDISHINMEDAENVEVLKDASATAIYGSRAANGVILITTKSGKKGIPVIDYKAYVGTQKRIDNLDVLNAEQWATLYNEASENDGIPLNQELANPSSLQSYNWKDLIYQSATIQNHQLSISGGSDNSTYYISGGFTDQDGIIKESSYRRINFRVNNTYQIMPQVKIGHNLLYSNATTNSIPEYGNSESRAAFIGYISDPVSPIYKPDGSLGSSKYNSFTGNPMGVVKYRTSEAIRESFMGNLFLELDIVEGLKFKSNYGLEVNNRKDDNYTPKHNVSPAFNSDVTTYNLRRYENRVMVLSNTLNYNVDIAGKHSLNAMLGQEIQEMNFNNVVAERNEIPESVETPTLGAGAVYTATNDGTISKSRLSSFFGRINYNLSDRYLFTGTYRIDGSSSFGSNNRWATFPSLALGWNVHNESFYSSSIINQMKVRLGWGETGNQNIPATATYNILNIGTNTVFANDETSLGVAPLRYGNPDLKWETTVTKNIGVDLSFLKSSLVLSVDYYTRETTDMLLETPVLLSLGYENNPYTNVGDIENNGLEFTLNYQKRINDFFFNVGGNVSFVENKVIRLASGDGAIFAGSGSGGLQNYSITKAGHPIGSFYGYEAIGIFQNQGEIDSYPHIAGTEPGDVKYADISGPEGKPDGVINNNDMTIIGSPFPDVTFGFNIEMQYKQFDFTAFFQGTHGNDIFDATVTNLMGSTISNFRVEMLDRWTGEGTSNTVPRVTHENQAINTLQSTRFIKDGSYLRLKNIQLGYSLPDRMLNGTFISDLRFYMAAQNLFTITKYDGLDPELGIDPTRGVTAIGIDEGRYPTARTYSLGLNIKF